MTGSAKSDDLFRQAMRAWETAAEAGVKMQEECATWVRQMFCESSTLSEWYEKGRKAMSETLAKSQENVDEAIRLMNQQAEASLKLIQKALEVRDTEAPADGPAKLANWWQAALETMRTNNQAVLKANSRILSTWSEMARKVNGEAAETMADLAKKTSEQAEHMAAASVERFKEMAAQASSNGT
jgi:uncharacterized protein YjgD (DUF1641 family)